MFHLLEGAFLLLLGRLALSSDDCSAFSSSVCQLKLNNVISINKYEEFERGNIDNQCQMDCILDQQCQNFTFFSPTVPGLQSTCILFKSCKESSFCTSCISGPSEPPLDDCGVRLLLDSILGGESQLLRQPKQLEEDEEETVVDEEGSADVGDVVTIQDTRDIDISDADMEESSEGEEDEDEDVPEVTGIDEGLFEGDDEATTEASVEEEEVDDGDNFFGEEDYADGDKDEEGTRSDEEEGSVDADGNKKRRPTFFYCVLGGYGPLGPLPSVDHVMNNRLPLIAPVPPLPPSFPLGTDGMFGTMHKGNLLACSPGASVNPAVLRPLIGAGPFDERFINIGIPRWPRFLAPGQCYMNRQSNWLPMGGPMNSVRLGSSMSKMGNFLITTGGRSRDDPNNEVEVLNLNKSKKWRKLSKIRMMNATYDHCSVALNKTAILVTGGVAQGNSASIINMKTKEVKETEPMREPRSKHSCMKVKINGQPGVVVAGGENEIDPAMRSIEFFDSNREKWVSLGNLRQGRRFPGLMVNRNKLTIAGGETTDPFGRNIILDDMERLDRRRWRPIRKRLPQRRSRFGQIRVPFNFF